MIKDPKKASGPKGLKVDISPEALDLFTKMIAEDPTARPTPADIIAHPWFNGEKVTKEQVDLY
jgi:serine/threonine protein kinase